ncbi:ReoY family proteolytic degradation factor [Bacillaceae bacterium W0354]
MNVTPEKKRIFIKWFLANHSFYHREIVWLLQYVMKRDHLLNQIHFVYEAHLCPRSIVISKVQDEKRPFRFYKDHVVTTEVDKAFHDIRLNPEESLFMEFIFDGVRQSLLYANVLEDNPYLPDDYYLNNEDYIYLEKFIETQTKEYEIKRLKQMIDDALDEGNEDDFLQWTDKLKNIQQKEK